jgi:hypothetical protein
MVRTWFRLRLSGLVLRRRWQGVDALRIVLLRSPSSLLVLSCVFALEVGFWEQLAELSRVW